MTDSASAASWRATTTAEWASDLAPPYMALGAFLALMLHYPQLIHGFNSKDIVQSTFHTRAGNCYRLTPRVVPCSWEQTPLLNPWPSGLNPWPSGLNPWPSGGWTSGRVEPASPPAPPPGS